MVTPRWVRVRAQPIAIEDVLAYLLEALDRVPEAGSCTRSAAPTSVTYLELMQEYASQRGLRRTMIPVPVLTPRLSSLWLWLVTPVYAGVGRKLVDSLRNETIVEDDRALEVFRVRPRGVRDAIARAIAFEDSEIAETRWSDEAFAEKAAVRWRAPRLTARRLTGRSTVAVAPAQASRRSSDRRRDRLVQGRDRSGASAGSSTCLSAGRAAPGRRDPDRVSRSATRSTSGASRRSSPTACCASRRDEGPGARLAAIRGLAADGGRRVDYHARLRSSTHRASSASSTGTGCGRSTATSSAACCATSSPPRTALAAEPGRRSKSAQTRHRHVTPLALAFLHGGGTQSDREA